MRHKKNRYDASRNMTADQAVRLVKVIRKRDGIGIDMPNKKVHDL